MVNLLRKYQQPALIGVTALVIVTFIWIWNGNQGRGGIGGANKVASIYGQPVTDLDVKRAVSKFQIAEALGLNDLLDGLTGGSENQQQAAENFVFNSYVIHHEADALQIFPTDAEVQDELGQVSGLQTDGRFDPAKLTDFVNNRLPQLGFTDTVIDDLIRDQLRVRKVGFLIGATVDISPAELENRFMASNEKMDVSVIRLNTSDLEKTITVSDDDAKKAYNGQMDAFHSEELRKVTIASFELTSAQKALTGKDRTAALQKLGTEAWNFAQAVVDKGSDFAGEAKKTDAAVSSSALFSQTQSDPALARISTLATDTFRLSTDYPNSDVLEGPDGYYVLHLEQTVPSRQLSFEEAKPKIIAQLKKERATQLMQTKGTDVRNRILADLNAGKSFSEAATAAGLAVENVPPFSLSDASKMDVPDSQSITQVALSLAKGQISTFSSTAAGGILVYMNDRQPPDKNAAAVGEMILQEKFDKQMKIGAFLEWLHLRRDAARLQIVQR